MPLNWYVLHSHPHKEELLWSQLESRGLLTYFPRLQVKPVNPRSRTIRPYFPGYLFVQADLDATGPSLFQWMPYTTGLVSFGGEPSTVPDAFINLLRQRIGNIGQFDPVASNGYQAGEKVVIMEGVFAGYEAIFDIHLPGSERVRVLLKMLNQRQVPVELRATQLRRKKDLR
jgi:transcription antitermination factor NusG